MLGPSLLWWWWFAKGDATPAEASPLPSAVRSLAAERFVDQIHFTWVEAAREGTPGYTHHDWRLKPSSRSNYVTDKVARAVTTHVLGPATLAADYTTDEIEETFEFGVRAEQDPGDGSGSTYGPYATIMSTLLPMPATGIGGFSIGAGFISLAVSHNGEAGRAASLWEVQVRLGSATDWTSLVTGYTVSFQEDRFNTGSDNLILVGGLTAGTQYDVRFRRVLRHNGTVWRGGTWYGSDDLTALSALHIAVPTLAAGTGGDSRRLRINTTLDVGQTAANQSAWSVQIKVGSGAWMDIGIHTFTRTPASGTPEAIEILTEAVPTSGGAITARVRYAQIPGADPVVQTDWVEATTTVSFANLSPSITITTQPMIFPLLGARKPAMVVVRNNFQGVYSDTGWEVEYTADGGTNWVTAGYMAAFVASDTFRILLDDMPLAGGTFDFRIRYPGEVDDWVEGTTTITLDDIRNVLTITMMQATGNRRVRLDGTFTQGDPGESLTAWQLEISTDASVWTDLGIANVRTGRTTDADDWRVQSVVFDDAGGTVYARTRVEQSDSSFSEWATTTSTITIPPATP